MNTTQQPEALRLAELCDNFQKLEKIGTELRRQHARIAELEGLGGGLKFGDVEVELVEAESPGDLVRSIRDYLGVHDGIKLGGHAMDDMALDLARIALRFQHLVAPPADPMDWPLPCDVTVGHGTMRKGVALRTLVLRMKGLYEMATGQNADEVAARTPEQRAELLSAFQAKIAPQAAQAVALLATGGQAQAVERIAIDMKQTAELLDLFGGEPTEFTVMQCNGHSGPGLYAYVTEYPEDGASYLGKTDCEAQPAPKAQEDARDVERWMGIGKAIERACMDLPDNTEVIVSLEKGAGTVTMIDQDGNEHENFSCDYGFAGVMNEAIDAALAAQAK